MIIHPERITKSDKRIVNDLDYVDTKNKKKDYIHLIIYLFICLSLSFFLSLFIYLFVYNRIYCWSTMLTITNKNHQQYYYTSNKVNFCK